MQEQWFADRLTLARLLTQHPDWRLQDFATATRRSVAWVKKWKHMIKHPRELRTARFSGVFYHGSVCSKRVRSIYRSVIIIGIARRPRGRTSGSRPLNT